MNRTPLSVELLVKLKALGLTAMTFRGSAPVLVFVCLSEAPFARVRTNFCTDKNLHGSTLRLHGTGGTGRIFERLSAQVWNLKKAGQRFDRHRAIFRPDSCKLPNRGIFCSERGYGLESNAATGLNFARIRVSTLQQNLHGSM